MLDTKQRQELSEWLHYRLMDDTDAQIHSLVSSVSYEQKEVMCNEFGENIQCIKSDEDMLYIMSKSFRKHMEDKGLPCDEKMWKSFTVIFGDDDILLKSNLKAIAKQVTPLNLFVGGDTLTLAYVVYNNIYASDIFVDDTEISDTPDLHTIYSIILAYASIGYVHVQYERALTLVRSVTSDSTIHLYALHNEIRKLGIYTDKNFIRLCSYIYATARYDVTFLLTPGDCLAILQHSHQHYQIEDIVDFYSETSHDTPADLIRNYLKRGSDEAAFQEFLCRIAPDMETIKRNYLNSVVHSVYPDVYVPIRELASIDTSFSSTSVIDKAFYVFNAVAVQEAIDRNADARITKIYMMSEWECQNKVFETLERGKIKVENTYRNRVLNAFSECITSPIKLAGKGQRALFVMSCYKYTIDILKGKGIWNLTS